MNRILSFGGLAATSTILMTTTALADISASEVWQAWQEDAARMGMSLTAANVTETGNGLDLSPLEFTATIPQFGEMEAPLDLRFNIGGVSLQENGGDVAVVWPENQEGVISVTYGQDGGALSFETTSTARTTNISGTTDEMTYDVNLESLAWKISDWSVTSDELSTADLAKLVFEMSGLMAGAEMQAIVNRENGWQADFTGKTATSSYEFLMDSGDSKLNQRQSQSQSGVNYTSRVTLPDAMDFTTAEGLIAALKGGLGIALNGSIDEMEQTQVQTTPMGEVTSNILAKDQTFDMQIDSGIVKVAGVAGETNVNIAGGMIPPVSIGAAGMDIDITAPLIADNTRARYMVALNEFTLNDEIWGMFDPAGMLSRDPAQLTIDLSADPSWQIDVLDLAAWENVGPDALPLMPNDIRLDAFELSAAGASITGTGEMSVNYDPVAKGEQPLPAGHIDLAASGINGLMDNLTKMGFLPEQQAMGARMMMGLFAVPGEGEDTLQSRLEINEAGEIRANGQRLK